MPAGSVRGLVLSVGDIEDTVASLKESGPPGEDLTIADAPWGRYVEVSDPDGNGWVVQEDRR